MKQPIIVREKLGFTLIEIMVVVAVIGILATVVGANLNSSSTKSRDAERQGDLRTLQTAIELYKNRNGRYPYQATSTGPSANGWSGEIGTNYQADNGTGQYIVGLAPAYIPVLPTDPKRNGVDSGYVYRTNAEGSAYKLKAHRTVEAEVVDYLHPMKACDIRVAPNVAGNPGIGSTDPRIRGWCGYTTNDLTSFSTPTTCNSLNEAFNKSYALWGGQVSLYSPVTYGANVYAADPLEIVAGATVPAKNLNRNRLIYQTTEVICK